MTGACDSTFPSEVETISFFACVLTYSPASVVTPFLYFTSFWLELWVIFSASTSQFFPGALKVMSPPSVSTV
ncbi:hypothetical protein D9M69_446050 [compost metagenome]